MPSFRPAAPADIVALHALIESAYRGESARRGWTHEADLLGGQRTDRDALAAMIADPGQTLILAEEAGALISKNLRPAIDLWHSSQIDVPAKDAPIPPILVRP